jgi:transposase
MGMGTRRRRQREEQMWIAHHKLAKGPAHPFYQRVNELLEEKKFDEFAGKECAKFYAEKNGRPSLTPGIYFRLLLVGYFEGIDSERGIAWRAADSLGLRKFLGISLDEQTADHSTISRTRRLMDVETHRKVFFWILEVLRDQGLVKGKTVGIDATTLEANVAMRSIVRRDTGESYEEFLKGLARESGIETPTREDLARLDRTRKNKARNADWVNPYDGDARITKMKDGRTHLAHKAENAVDFQTGAVLAVTLQGADQGDTTTVRETLSQAGENVADLIATEEPSSKPKAHLKGIEEVVGDKGYHSGEILTNLHSSMILQGPYVRQTLPLDQQDSVRGEIIATSDTSSGTQENRIPPRAARRQRRTTSRSLEGEMHLAVTRFRTIAVPVPCTFRNLNWTLSSASQERPVHQFPICRLRMSRNPSVHPDGCYQKRNRSLTESPCEFCLPPCSRLG